MVENDVGKCKCGKTGQETIHALAKWVHSMPTTTARKLSASSMASFIDDACVTHSAFIFELLVSQCHTYTVYSVKRHVVCRLT
jgi:hypothetical protein